MDERISALKSECMKKLQKHGFVEGDIELTPFLHLRYEGTDCPLMCSAENNGKGLPLNGDFEINFLKK